MANECTYGLGAPDPEHCVGDMVVSWDHVSECRDIPFKLFGKGLDVLRHRGLGGFRLLRPEPRRDARSQSQ